MARPRSTTLNPATQRRRAMHLRKFQEWGGKLPCTEDMLLSYLNGCRKEYSAGTVAHMAVSIDAWHVENGHESIVSASQLKKLWDKAQEKKSSREASPLELKDYKKVMKYLDKRLNEDLSDAEALEIIKTKCMFVTAWLSGKGYESIKRLTMDDVRITPTFVNVTLEGETMTLEADENQSVCVVNTYRRLVGLRGRGDGYVFFMSRDQKKDLHTQMHLTTFRRNMLKYLGEAGVENPEHYNFSSLREGHIKMLVEKGYTPADLMREGLFSSRAAAIRKAAEYKSGLDTGEDGE